MFTCNKCSCSFDDRAVYAACHDSLHYRDKSYPLLFCCWFCYFEHCEDLHASVNLV